MIGSLKSFGLGQDSSDELTADENELVGEVLADVGLFKEKTEYILIGDEVEGSAVFDLKTQLPAESFNQLKQFLTFMPRQIFREWFMENVWPSLPNDFINRQGAPVAELIYDPIYGTTSLKKSFEDFLWASFVDVFNEANLEYINDKQIDPWTWENEKFEAFVLSKNQDAIKDVEKEIDMFTTQGLESDPVAKSILEQFANLPKLGDTGLEINRQNALKQLLIQGEYKTAQAVVDVFRFIDESEMAQVAKEPIPFDIVSEDGQTIKKSN